MSWGNEPVGESLPAKADWSIHTHEEEKRPQEKAIQGRAVRDVRSHPTFLPPFGHKVHETIGGGKHKLRLFSILLDLRRLEPQIIIWLVGNTMVRLIC